MMAAPSAFIHVLPSAWSKCQWVLIRCLIGSRLRLLAALRIRERDAVIPASMKTLPSDPVSTAMFPPDPSKMLTSRRSLCNLDRGPGSVVADRVHDVAGLGKGFARRKPAPRC